MMLSKIIISLIMIGMVVPAAFAVDEKVLSQLPKYSLCKSRKSARTIRVVSNAEKECVTIYTKAGVDKVVGTATLTASCFYIYNNITKNLKAAGWNCKDISAAKMAQPK